MAATALRALPAPQSCLPAARGSHRSVCAPAAIPAARSGDGLSSSKYLYSVTRKPDGKRHTHKKSSLLHTENEIKGTFKGTWIYTT